MKKNFVLSLITAAVMPFALVSCSGTAENSSVSEISQNTETEEITGEITEKETEKTKATTENKETDEKNDGDIQSLEYERVDIDEVNEAVAKLLDDVEISGGEKNVREDIEKLLEYEDRAAEFYALAEIEYFYDWQNEAVNEKYNALGEDFTVIDTALTYAFCNAALAEEYADLFTELIFDNPEDNEAFTGRGVSLRRMEEYARVDFMLGDEMLDEYYAAAYDEDMTEDEKDLKCAEIYIDILSMYDPETFYDLYYRDFTPEEAIQTAGLVIDEIIPAYGELIDAYLKLDSNDELFNIKGVKEPFEVIRKYAPELSDSIKETADMIIDEELYRVGDDTKSMDAGFTVVLPVENKAEIYNIGYDSYRDLTDWVHEFGHFYAICKDRTPAYLQINNLDVAEIQSQAMEILFTRFYDDIYGENADIVKTAVISDILASIVDSFVIGQFEYEMVRDIESLTPQDVVDRFDETVRSIDPEQRFYFIHHLFEQPGYYISYGVSALAAFDIFDDNMNNPARAVEKYEKIAAVSAFSPDCRFKDTLKQCGFDDVFTEEYIKNLAEQITEYAHQVIKKHS
ncbi:MAG: hypothetical protein IJ666_08705 [Ruminococcus sp.]|nr:hypothetical protein [Ruminococcus sp.]